MEGRKPLPASGPDWAETLIADFPDVYREYLYLEDALCSAYTMTFMTYREKDAAEKRIDQLFRFFRFDYVREKHNTRFWGGVKPR